MLKGRIGFPMLQCMGELGTDAIVYGGMVEKSPHGDKFPHNDGLHPNPLVLRDLLNNWRIWVDNCLRTIIGLYYRPAHAP